MKLLKWLDDGEGYESIKSQSIFFNEQHKQQMLYLLGRKLVQPNQGESQYKYE